MIFLNHIIVERTSKILENLFLKKDISITKILNLTANRMYSDFLYQVQNGILILTKSFKIINPERLGGGGYKLSITV